MKHHYVEIEIKSDGTLGKLTAYTEVNGKRLSPPNFLRRVEHGNDRGRRRLLRDIEKAD